ncbi:MAG: hypothetical protein GY820_08360 [Gammaproteobacteria bacterium]|nr:hypothetical protein [Gammaproteobacteria bacterium]
MYLGVGPAAETEIEEDPQLAKLDWARHTKENQPTFQINGKEKANIMFVEAHHLLWKRLSRMKKQGDKRLHSGRREAKQTIF